MIDKETYTATLRRYLPESAVETIFTYFTQTHSIKFHITRNRVSKLGDYRWPQPHHQYHEISVNGNLNPYFFLWVLLHEMAHLETWETHKNTVPPHGHEWQQQYAQLIITHEIHFPQELRPLLHRFAKRIPLSHALSHEIESSLRQYDSGYVPHTVLTLNDLTPGDCFYVKAHPQPHFQAKEKRRTRWVCTALDSGNNYLVQGSAEVVKIDSTN